MRGHDLAAFEQLKVGKLVAPGLEVIGGVTVDTCLLELRPRQQRLREHMVDVVNIARVDVWE